jgi:hypothetical protein
MRSPDAAGPGSTRQASIAARCSGGCATATRSPPYPPPTRRMSRECRAYVAAGDSYRRRGPDRLPWAAASVPSQSCKERRAGLPLRPDPPARSCRNRTTRGPGPTTNLLRTSLRCPLPAARCPLPAARCPLPAARCPLPAARCTTRCVGSDMARPTTEEGVKAWNENPKPFIWTKPAEEILASLTRLL